MTLPPIPILYFLATIAGHVVLFIFSIIHTIVFVLSGNLVLPEEMLITEVEKNARVVRKFLFLPLVRFDEQGYDWLHWRNVYQKYDDADGWAVGQWSDQWVMRGNQW